MRTRTKLIAFAAALVLAFGTAAAVGAAVGPIDVGGSTPVHDSDTNEPVSHDPSGHLGAPSTEPEP